MVDEIAAHSRADEARATRNKNTHTPHSPAALLACFSPPHLSCIYAPLFVSDSIIWRSFTA